DALLHLAAKLAGDEWHGKLDGEARREGVAKQKLGDETVEPLARVGHLLTVLLPSTEIRVLLRHAHPHTGAALALLRRGVDGAHVTGEDPQRHGEHVQQQPGAMREDCYDAACLHRAFPVSAAPTLLEHRTPSTEHRQSGVIPGQQSAFCGW